MRITRRGSDPAQAVYLCLCVNVRIFVRKYISEEETADETEVE